jgi:hypothetical protein
MGHLKLKKYDCTHNGLMTFDDIIYTINNRIVIFYLIGKFIFSPKNFKNYKEEMNNKMIIPKYFTILFKKLEKFCFTSPISSYGMLIFGLRSLIFFLYHPRYLK